MDKEAIVVLLFYIGIVFFSLEYSNSNFFYIFIVDRLERIDSNMILCFIINYVLVKPASY